MIPDTITVVDRSRPHGRRNGIDAGKRLPVVSDPDQLADELTRGWIAPRPLISRTAAEEYPLDALPSTVREAVDEVQAFVKAPSPLVACSALSALSLAIQGHVDVMRAERLSGPVSLFPLAIADSGERKSTCDRVFGAAARDYEIEQADLAKPGLAIYRADQAGWEARRAGALESIRAKSKKGEWSDLDQRRLQEIECARPNAPRTPRLLYADATPEALTFGLRSWPSAGIFSSEGGAVLGSHGMGPDSAMRYMASLNSFWDGTPQTFDRRKEDGTFVLRGARLTLSVQIQAPALQAFVRKSGDLPRGIGFFARCLIAWPNSTQGQRHFTEPPASWPALARFNRQITEILRLPLTIETDGALTPRPMALSQTAKAAWVSFHDLIESELGKGGDLYDVRDVASKTADNAARLAALFQVFEHGLDGDIQLASFEGAARIAAWHLNESKRFFGELALPADLAAAAHLDQWLIDHCNRNKVVCVATRKVAQFGPAGLRSRGAMESAMRDLEELGRARFMMDGRSKLIVVNPALLANRRPA